MLVSVTITDSRELEVGDAIRSVVDHVDRVLLVDTGIKDGTEAVAREVAKEKLRVAKHAWVDYSTARNAGFRFAEELGATWMVIVDTDERISFGELDLGAELKTIKEDVVTIESCTGFYSKEKILRAGRGAYFSGPTHEFLHCGSRTKLKGATFLELEKSKEQYKKKYTRDVALLSAYLLKEPNAARWWYYLGVSYEGLGEFKKAADSFSRCVLLGRFGGEAAWAAYKHAEMLYLLNEFEGAIYAAARGLAADATYAECAWMGGLAAFKLGRKDQAIAWARLAESVGRFKGSGRVHGAGREHFKHLPALYELPYDILRYALPDGEERKQAENDFVRAKLCRLGIDSQEELDQLSVSRRALAVRRDEARSMLRPAALDALLPSTRKTKIQFEPPDGYRPMNPSICRHEGELWCVVRAVNYSMSGRQYSIDDPDGIVRTENYLGRLLLSGELVEAKRMRDLDPSPRQASKIVGYEDIRLVSLEGPDGPTLAGSCTVCDRDAARRMIARLDLDREGNVTFAHVQKSRQTHEKNWMPVVVGRSIRFIYSLDPTIVTPEDARGTCPLALDHARGGAAIAFDGGYLCVVHETIEAVETRIYLHRFARLDAEFNVTAVSPCWIFQGYGIEFCAGIALDGDDIVLSYGVADREAWIARVKATELREMNWMMP